MHTYIHIGWGVYSALYDGPPATAPPPAAAAAAAAASAAARSAAVESALVMPSPAVSGTLSPHTLGAYTRSLRFQTLVP
jgi:hypothetical protein